MENSAKNAGTEQDYAVAYLRLSKQDKECGIPESDSIESQRLIISQYCAQNGLTIVGESHQAKTSIVRTSAGC